MNTPAHLVLNSAVLGRGKWNRLWFPITCGALLPDLPMFGFYFVERLVLGNSERFIWTEAYFDPAWQAFFDIFNSVPIILVGALIAMRMKKEGWLALFGSMGLHCLADFPLHNDDAHAHFFPLTNWHLHSPVSYWDPQHHGQWFAIGELLLVLMCCAILARRKGSRAWPVIGIVTLAIYALFAVFAFFVWMR